MSEYEKKSLAKFLGLYLGSAFVFITVIALLLYFIKIENVAELGRQKLKNASSSISADIIDSHMRGGEYRIPQQSEFKVALIGNEDKIIYSNLTALPPLKPGFYEKDQLTWVIDGSPRLHHGVKYVITEADLLSGEKREAVYTSFFVWLSSMLLVVALAFKLSRQFLAPIRQEIDKLDDFVKASAHELNTPITALVLSLDGLKKEVTDPSKIEHLKASAKMLSKIYEDLTYYLQREMQRKNEEWIDFLQLCTQKAVFYGKLGAAKNISVQVSGESFIYRIDTAAASRLIDNLLSNAVKYSKQNGNVKITVAQNMIEIEDDGIGIDEAARAQIFQKFKRATASGGGFGLGLYIVKTICDDYKIKIELSGEEGVGSKFRLIF